MRNDKYNAYYLRKLREKEENVTLKVCNIEHLLRVGKEIASDKDRISRDTKITITAESLAGVYTYVEELKARLRQAEPEEW